MEGTEPFGKGYDGYSLLCYRATNISLIIIRQEDYLAVWEGGGYLGFPIVVEVGREPELVAGEHGADVYRHEGPLLSSQQAGTGPIVYSTKRPTEDSQAVGPVGLSSFIKVKFSRE